MYNQESEGRRFESCRARPRKSCKSETYSYISRSPPTLYAATCVFNTHPGRVSNERSRQAGHRKEMERDVRVAVLAAKASEPTQKEEKRDVIAASSLEAPD